MNTMNTLLYAIGGFIGLLIIYLIFAYNRFVTLANRIKEAWSDIEIQLKRRYDLIPNLIETVKGYATHEKGLFEEVTKARTLAMGAQGVKDHAQAENILSGTLKSLFAVAEAYPDLKASNNFAQLHDELADTENKIQAARRFYNSNVIEMNVKMESFPSGVVGRMFGFQKSEFFELEEKAAREPVKVAF